jgi:DNA repair exonuclease SbcCD nuclease subunit
VDEYDEESAPEVETEEVPATEDKDLQKLRKENQSLRQRLRRSELEGEFGDKIAEVVAKSGRPVNEWADYAAEIKALIPEVAPESKTEPAAEEPSPEEEPSGLAAVAKGPATASSQANAASELSAKELGDLAETDPSRFYAAIAAKYGNE